MKTWIFAGCVALASAFGAHADDTNPLVPFPSPLTAASGGGGGGTGPSGTCGTTNAVAIFSAASTLTCFSTFKFDGTTLTLPATWSLPSATTATLGNANGLTFTGGPVGIGTGGAIAGDLFDVNQNQNAPTFIGAQNLTAGTAARAGVGLSVDGGSLTFELHSSLWTTSGLSVANQAMWNLSSGMTGGGFFMLQSDAPWMFVTASGIGASVTNERFRIQKEGVVLSNGSKLITDGAAPIDGGGSCSGEAIGTKSTSTSGSVSATCAANETIILTLVDTFTNAPNCYLTAIDADAVTAAFFVSAEAAGSVTFKAAVGSASAADLNYFCVESR